MKKRILFIERRSSDFSIETVFRQVAKSLSREKFDTAIEKMPFGNDLIGTIKNLLFFKCPSADVYHITGHIHYMALRLPAERTVLTVHDLRFLFERRGLRRYVLKKLLLDWPVKRAGYVTAISEKTKREILANTNCDPQKIWVIENPLFDEFKNKQSRQKFSKERPVILQIGYMRNKNISNLIKALKDLPCSLIIVGKISRDLVDELEENNIHYEIKLEMDLKELIIEYQNSDIVAFCSTYEGFGLPIIEAQALGKPLVTSNLSPMREVSGGAAVLVDPHEVDSIRAGILQLIEDDRLRENNIEKGFENVRRFDSSHISKCYEELYFTVLGNLNPCIPKNDKV